MSTHGIYIAFSVIMIIYLLLDYQAAHHRSTDHQAPSDVMDTERLDQGDDAA